MPDSGRESLLFLLKTRGPQTAARMAKQLGVTTMAMRGSQKLGLAGGAQFAAVDLIHKVDRLEEYFDHLSRGAL